MGKSSFIAVGTQMLVPVDSGEVQERHALHLCCVARILFFVHSIGFAENFPHTIIAPRTFSSIFREKKGEDYGSKYGIFNHFIVPRGRIIIQSMAHNSL